MKKFIALLLVAVMCLSFVSCGNESNNDSNNDTTQIAEPNLKIIGTWKTDPAYNDYVLIINKDHTGSLSEGDETETLTWTYDAETHTLTLTKDNMPDTPPMPLTYVESNDTLVSMGPTFRRAE